MLKLNLKMKVIIKINYWLLFKKISKIQLLYKKGERIDEILRLIGISEDKLSSKAKEQLNAIAQIAEKLNLRNTMIDNFYLKWSDIILNQSKKIKENV